MTDDRKPGERVGPWTLLELLGEGGNAKVWRATHEDGREVALKILKSLRRPEPYERFRREVETLRRLAGRPGILPILESSLPETPSRQDPPWIAMPIAEGLLVKIADASLHELVEAFRAIAETLAALHSEGISHRDVKPSNLYWYEGRPAVGDFGLVQLPEPSDLTDPDRPIGARNFVPYELIADPANADGAPVDVFMLLKSFWAMATRNEWPPQGEQRADNSPISLTAYQAHPRARVLDFLMERATRHTPGERPTMEEVARDLHAWLTLPTEGPEADMEDGIARLRRAAAPALDQAAKRAHQKALLRNHASRIAGAIGPIEARIAADFPVTVADGYDALVDGALRHPESLGSPSVLEADIRATRVDEPEDFPRSLVVGRSLALTDDGLLHADGIAAMGYLDVTGSEDLWRFQPAPVPIESIEATSEVDRLIDEIVTGFPRWIKAFADEIAE
jgi:serine/threonine protein kinase